MSGNILMISNRSFDFTDQQSPGLQPQDGKKVPGDGG